MADNLIQSKGKNALTTQKEELKRSGIVTPVGASIAGQNPDQAKMYGTPAQTQKKIETIQQQPAVSTATAPSEKQKKAEELQGLSGIQSQVQALADQRLNELQDVTPALSISEDVLKTYPTGTKEILDAYTAAPTEETKAAAIANLSSLLGRELTTQELESFFQSKEETIASGAQIAPVKIGDLGLGNLVKPETLGLSQEEFDNLSLDDFKQKMSDLQKQEFQSTENLQLQMANAVGQQREELKQKFSQAGVAGDIGVEQQVSNLMSRVEEGDEITFGGEKIKLQDLLKDDGLSDIVLTAFQNADFMKKLQETEPEFATWLNENKAALESVFDELGDAGANVQQATAKRKELLNTTPLSIVESILGDRLPEFMTLGDMTELENQLNSNPIWAAMADSSMLKDRVLKDKKLIGSLSGLSAEQINSIVQATTAIESDPAMVDILGYTPGGLLTEAQAQRYQTLAPAIKNIPNYVKADSKFKDAVRSDELSVDDLAIITQTPKIWDRVLENENMREEYELNKDDVEDLMSMYFGGTTNLESINKGLTRLKAYADSGDVEALKKYEFITKNFAGENGIVGQEDLDLIRSFAALPDAQSLSDVVKNGPTFTDILKQSKSNLQTGLGFESEDTTRRMVVPYLLGDSKLQDNELEELLSNSSDAQFLKMMDQPWFRNTIENPQTWDNRKLQIESKPMVSKYIDETVFDVASSLAGLPVFSQFKVNPNTGKITYKIESKFMTPEHYKSATSSLKEYMDFTERQMLETSNPYYKEQLNNLLTEARAIAADLDKNKPAAASYDRGARGGDSYTPTYGKGAEEKLRDKMGPQYN